MSQKKPSYDELKRRLAAAESALTAIREGRVDSILGERQTLVVRLAEAEAREAHLKQVLLAIRNVNQLIAAEDDPESLIWKACQNLTATMGYFNAWIALLDPGQQRVIKVASDGFNGGFAPLRKKLEGGQFPSCMTRTLGRKELVVTPDPASECPDCPLSSQYHERAAFTHRLEFQGRVFGLLSVSVPAALAHDAEEQAFFSGVTRDLAFALNKIETQKDVRLKNHIINTLDQPMSFVSRDYRYLTVNAAYSRFYGLSAEEITGRQIADFCGEELFERDIRPHLDRCLKGETVKYEVLVDFPAAGSRWMLMEYSPYRDRDGHIMGVVSHGRDITRRRVAEDKLQHSEHKLRSLVENTVDWVWEVDAEGRYVYCSPGTEKIIGYSPEDLLGRTPFQLMDAPEATRVGVLFAEKMKNRERLFNLEDTMRHQNGTPVIFETNAAPVFDPAGLFLGYFGTCRDITERKRIEADLVQSEKNYHDIFDNSSDCIFIHDAATGAIVDVNRTTCETFGYSAEEMKNLGVGDLSLNQPPYTSAEAVEWIQKAYSQGPQKFEWLAKDRQGRLVWFENSLLHAKIAGKELVLVFGRNIDDRKKTEVELRKSEKKWRSYVQNAPFGVFITDHRGRYLEVNPAACEITGYTEEELLTMSIPDLMPPGNEEETSAHFQRLLDTGFSRGEVGLLHKNGQVRRWSVNAVKLSEDRFLGFTEDITERNLAAEALRQSRERLQAIFNTADNVAFIVTNADDTEPEILEFSLGAENIFGYSKEEIIGKPVSILYLPEDVVRLRETIKKMHKGQKGDDGKITLVRKSGERFTALLSTYPLFDKKGRMVARLGVSLDISRQESLQEMLNQSQKMESVGRLAGGVAHDFNNMLSVIIGHTELVLDEVVAENQFYEDLKEIRSAARRAAELTRQLLAFARKQAIAPKILDLNATVESMLRMLGRLIGEDIDLTFMPGKDLYTVKMDPSQLDQVLANLCVNARDAISGVGKISIETKNVSFDQAYCDDHAGFVPGDYVLLAVSDNGCGMDRETAANVFESFFTTKATGQGTGLGLSTVYGIVKQNKGFVNVYSEPGHGTTFRIYLPGHQQMEKIDALKRTEKIVPGRGETVLLVEDEASIMRMGKKMLEKLGYTVLTAEDPARAIQIAREHADDIHLLITDVVMPEMNGRELAEYLAASCPGLKVLYMSGYTADVIADQGVLESDIHFMQKPFSSADIAAAVSKALESDQ